MDDCQGTATLRPSALYICYMSVREPLIQTQVLPYLRALSDSYQIVLLSFETTEEDDTGWTERLGAQGIHWEHLRYHKGLPKTMYDIANGARTVRRLHRKWNFRLLHARSHVPMLMATLARTGAKLLFDIRGFFPEEYVDMGLWPAGGALYRGTKVVEKRLLAAADGFVVLTTPAKEALFAEESRPVEVIPCCVDLERFRAAQALNRDALREELGFAGRKVIVYVGALGGMYLTNELADFYAAARERDPKAFALAITQSQPEMLGDPLRALGMTEKHFLIRKVAPAEVPRWLRASDLAVSFIKPTYAKIASSPTKIAEYLASGLPVISNAGIGELDRQLPGARVGVIFNRFQRDAYLEAFAQAEKLTADPELPKCCQQVAHDFYDLERIGGARYRRLYAKMLAG
jgi:glycosyltransferase involved in cell wall biosynthesis